MPQAAPPGSRAALMLLLGGAFLLRVIMIPVTHLHGFTSDEREYMHLAAGVAAGDGFIDTNGDRAVRAPLYPLLLTLIVWFPWWIQLAEVAGALLGVLTAYLGYRLALEMGTGETAALVTAGTIAVHPGLAIYSALLQTEMLYTVFLLSLILVCIRLWREPRWMWGALAGILGGVAALTRPVALGFFVVTLCLLLWLGRTEWRRRVLPVVVAMCSFCAVLAPWTVRNYAMFGSLVPVSSGGGSSLLLANNPFASGGLKVQNGFTEWYREQRDGRTVANEVERASVDGEIAGRFIREEPVQALALAVRKSHIYWVYPATHTDSDVRIQLPAVAADLLLMFGAVVGLAFLHPPRFTAAVTAMAILFFWLAQVVLHAEARFRLPVVPLIACSWSVGVLALRTPQGLLERVRQTGRHVAVAAGLLAVLCVYGLTAWMFITGRL